MADDLTAILEQWNHGDRAALDRALPIVYDELRRIARLYLSREREGHTLQPTALVHEAYISLLGQHSVTWQNRAHFLGLAAQLMRRVLLRHAESRNADKRLGQARRVELDEHLACLEKHCDVDIIVLDRALDRLAAQDERQARIVELRCFSGLNIEETAEVMSLSPATVKRDWSVARLWLRRELRGEA